MYLLDSNIIINYLKKGTSLNADLLENIKFISVINYLEIQYGNKKYQRVSNQELKFKELINVANIRIIPVDTRIVDKEIEIRLYLENKGIRIEDFDLLIAATALVYDLTLVTRNIKHFNKIPHLKIYKF